MREKQLRFLITFHTTQEAMAAERFFKEQGISGRLIPVPRQITAGCGLAWMSALEGQKAVLDGLEMGGLSWQDSHELVL